MAPPVAAPSVEALPTARIQLDVRLLVALASVYIVWGSTYFAMRVAVAGLPPLGMGAVRFVIAGALLLGIARVRGSAWPTSRQWLATLPIGALFFVGGNGLVAVAEQSIDSGIAAVVCATMPLWTAVIASATGEPTSRREWIGLAVGFAGVVLLVGGASTRGEPLHFVLVLLSPLSWAIGAVLSRRVAMPGGLTAAGAQMLTGGLAMAVVSLALGETWPTTQPAGAWLALAYLVVFGSLIGFTAFAWLLRNTRPAVATSYAYVNPAIAVLVGAALGGEILGISTIASTGLIVAAVALVVTGKRR